MVLYSTHKVRVFAIFCWLKGQESESKGIQDS
jgi:hypothetical protein